MAGCSHTMSCGSLNNSMLEELDIQQLVESNCEMMGVCGERIILVLADLVMCLTGACEENEFPDWARPATCAAIAITALVFFSLMYFGKSCSESRVKVSSSASRIQLYQPSNIGPSKVHTSQMCQTICHQDLFTCCVPF